MRLGLSCAVILFLSACGAGSPASLDYVDHVPDNPQIGQTTTIRFRALDSTGNPQAGVSVKFSLQSNSQGVTLNPTSGLTNKGDGMVETQLTASQRVASAIVVATAGDKTAVSPPISFAGATPSGRQFTFQCGNLGGPATGGIHGVLAYDETRSLIPGTTINCVAHVADQNGDGIAGAVVSFITEAGAIGPSSTTITDAVGNATVLHKTAFPLPLDVDPGVYAAKPSIDQQHVSWCNVSGCQGQYLAPWWMHPFEWKQDPVNQFFLPPNNQEPRRIDPQSGFLTFNPRDNLVTMIAVTAGAEGFTDKNGNGKWDPGEDFDDLPEPFVDMNDNGTWDPFEPFIDTNGDGTWTPKNGQYDGNTLIWAQERILWTGLPSDLDFTGSQPVFRVLGTPPAIPHLGTATVSFVMADPWFNSISENAGGDGCDVDFGSIGNPLVLALGTRFAPGINRTYPSGRLVAIDLTDGHVASGLGQFGSPVPFSYPINCRFTSSPNNGFTTSIRIEGVVQGTVL